MEDTTRASSSAVSSAPPTVAELNGHLHLELPDPGKLEIALLFATSEHTSDEPPVREHYRLEYLGDAALALSASTFLYGHFPEMPEGDLTPLRAWLVCAPTLTAWAHQLGLERWLRLPSPSDEPGGRNRERLFHSVFEAIVGVLYLQRGLDAVDRFLLPLFEQWTPRFREHGRGPKNRFQELVQGQGGPVPAYRVAGTEGPPHAYLFTVEVLVEDRVWGRGVATSKQAAEKAAAEQAIAAWNSNRHRTDRHGRRA